MSISTAYAKLSPWFDRWVRVMEIHTRRLELQDARLGELNAMIISPPTDTGIRMIARANEAGTTCLLCWSAQVLEAAGRDARTHGLPQLQLLRAAVPAVPLRDSVLDVVFANCVFDFCDDDETEGILAELARVLRPGGSLFAVYVGQPAGALARVWCRLVENLPPMGLGCRPVDILPSLRRHGFGDPEERCPTRLGLPLRYVHAKAP